MQRQLTGDEEFSDLLDILQKKCELTDIDDDGEWYHLYRVINSIENARLLQESLSFDVKIFVDQWPKFSVIYIILFKENEYMIIPYMDPYQEVSSYELHMENVLLSLISQHVELRNVIFGLLSSYLYDALKKHLPEHCILNSNTGFWLPRAVNYSVEQLSDSAKRAHLSHSSVNCCQASDIDDFCRNWKYSCYWNKKDLALILENLPAVFLYEENNKLVGHFMSSLYGTCGALFVDEKIRKQGLGGLLIRNLAVACDRRNRRVLVEVENHNTASYELFRKEGFLPACQTFYVQIGSAERNEIV